MHDRRPRLAVPATLALLVATTIGYASWYSARLFDPAVFDHQYRTGVYRYRVVGRELVWWAYRGIGNPLGDHLPAASPGAGLLFTAYAVVNGTAFVLTAVLAHRLLGRSRVPDGSARTLVWVSLVTIVALSSYVVTPYDQLSYVLLLAVLLAADARPPLDLLAPAIALLAVANRESALVAVAALAADRWPAPGQAVGAWLRTRPARVLLATAAATVVGYLALRLALGTEGGGAAWAQLALRGNVGRLTGWFGAGLLVALAWWWWAACAEAGLGAGPAARTAVRRYWALATPYLLVAGLTGYWFEVRLLVPLLVAELWLRVRADAAADPARMVA